MSNVHITTTWRDTLKNVIHKLMDMNFMHSAQLYKSEFDYERSDYDNVPVADWANNYIERLTALRILFRECLPLNTETSLSLEKAGELLKAIERLDRAAMYAHVAIAEALEKEGLSEELNEFNTDMRDCIDDLRSLH